MIKKNFNYKLHSKQSKSLYKDIWLSLFQFHEFHNDNCFISEMLGNKLNQDKQL